MCLQHQRLKLTEHAFEKGIICVMPLLPFSVSKAIYTEKYYSFIDRSSF